EQTLSQLIKRHELIEPLPIKSFSLNTERLAEGIYSILPEIYFGEPHPLDIITPSWWSYPGTSINTVWGYTKYYHDRFGIKEIWESVGTEPDQDPIESQWATRYPDEPNIPRAWRK